VLLLSNKEQIKRTVKNYKELDGGFKEIRNGLIQANISQFPIITSEPGYTSGKAENFGYNVVGDIFLAFAHWILKEAQSRGIKRLAFLARDGEIVKKVFDHINKTDIESVYILASRRCVRVASMINRDDVVREIDSFVDSLNEKNNEILNFLSLRFGISTDIITNVLGPDFSYHYNEREILKNKLLSDEFISPVLSNSAEERVNYTNYLNDNHIDSETAFVDIGHNGSLQASICKLLDLKKSLGLYFATYEGVVDTLGIVDGEHVGLGYYRDKISTKDRSDNYIRYALMIETLFLNDKGTFIKFELENDKLEPRYLSVEKEGKRITFINSMQSGIMNYVSDVTSTLAALDMDICATEEFSRSFDPCARFEIMKNPMLRDARMFSGVTMENFLRT
jgi:predicted HAD superfamily hydrolase